MPISLEICVDSVESAVAAAAGGADRIELCRALRAGGLTPREELIRAVRDAVDIDVFVMIRPRSGNFVYSRDETATMMQEIENAKSWGADGVVLGALLADSEIDVETTHALVDRARPLEVTFHRAFDLCPDLERSLRDVITTGADRVLTSAGAKEAVQATDKLARLVELAEGKTRIMAGGGVRRQNVRDLVIASGVRDVHSTLGFSEWCKNLDWNDAEEDDGECSAASRYVVSKSDVHAMRTILSELEDSKNVGVSQEG